MGGEYGIIGNAGQAALIDRYGTIEWGAFPSIDSSYHFGPIHSIHNGGDHRFQLCPLGEFNSEQRALERTHVMETTFETPFGQATLIDWMPFEYPGSIIYRRLEVTQGKIQFILNCSPRFGTTSGAPEFQNGDILFRGSREGEIARLSASIPLQISPADSGSSLTSTARHARSVFTLERGQSAVFQWNWGLSAPKLNTSLGDVNANATIEAWKRSAHQCNPETCAFVGPWHDTVARSGLLIKLMTQPETGAIAQSITEPITQPPLGESNRHASIKDGAFAIQALANSGSADECKTWFRGLADLLQRDGADGLQSTYRLDGGRIDSGFQLSLYGQTLLAASEYHRVFGSLPQGVWPHLSALADLAGQAWRRPDHGFWGGTEKKPEHFVVSKLFAWVALDRAIRLASDLRESAPSRWARERDVLHQTICQQGYDESRGCFVRSFGDLSLDPATLLMPILGFLPIEDSRIIGTLASIQADLSTGILLRREAGADSCDLLSSLWLVQCLVLAGQVDEASDRLAEICSYANASGVFGEFVRPETGEMTGRFPSSAVHLGLINTALYVGVARGRVIPNGHLMGHPDGMPKERTKEIKDVPCESRGAERKRAS